jgi:hypothetical protein
LTNAVSINITTGHTEGRYGTHDIRLCFWQKIQKNQHHRKDILRDMAEDAGRYLISLPTYSSDLNKIEYALWANLKNHLRNHLKYFAVLDDAVMDYFQFK